MVAALTRAKEFIVGKNAVQMSAAITAGKSPVTKSAEAIKATLVALLVLAAIIAAVGGLSSFGKLNLSWAGNSIGSNQAFWALVAGGGASLLLLTAIITQSAIQHKIQKKAVEA